MCPHDCRHMGEHQTSSDMLERALFAMECAFHPSFRPSVERQQENVLLQTDNIPLVDFDSNNNKPLFVALNIHVQSLSKRGCHRSAFEICKFLLQLDMSDPCGVLLRLDYCAIKASQYDWLLEFVDKYDNISISSKSDNAEFRLSLRSMPNIQFSVALALFLIESDDDYRNKKNDSSARSKSANEALEQALALYPDIFLKLVSKLPISTDSEWKYAMSSPFFVMNAASSNVNENATLSHLVDIYVERCSTLWRGKPEQDFLKRAALKIARAFDHDQNNSNAPNVVTSCVAGLALQVWASARSETFPASRVNYYRHLRLADYSDTLTPTNLNPEVMGMEAGNGNFGVDGEYRADANNNQMEAVQQRVNMFIRERNIDVRNMEPLDTVRLFFETMMPWVRVNHDNGELNVDAMLRAIENNEVVNDNNEEPQREDT